MTVVPELKAQQSEINKHLQHITRRWSELGQDVKLEIVCLSADDRAAVKDVARFSPDAFGIDMAAEHAAAMNAHKINVYAVINPVDGTRPLQAGKRASRADIVASFYHWADADDAQAAENIRSFVGPKCTFHVLTGTQPCMRPHVYWELEEPTRNLDAWERTQKAIAATLKTDPSVTDAPRIMRVAGTINWPKPQKQGKGYVAELTTLRIYDNEERPPVSSDRMARAFSGAAVNAPPSQASVGGLQIDIGPQALDRQQARADALAGINWNVNVFKIVGSLVRHGMADDEILYDTERLTLPGYTIEQTRDEVRTMIERTRENPEFTPDRVDVKTERAMAIALDVAPKVAPFKSWEPINPLALPPRDFVYGNHYIRKFASVTVAPGGLGKSTLVLAECLAIATGMPIIGIQPKQRERVVYFNAEDPLEEVQRRVLALCQHHRINQSELVDWLFLASGRETELILAVGEAGEIVEPVFELIESYARDIKPAVFAFDPLANMTESPETNDVFRRLGKRLSRMADAHNCSIEIVHHTRKLNGKEAEVEDSRGGGALIGAVRAGRVLNPMTADEATKAGIETHIDHFRIEAAGKNNLSRPSPHATWLHRVSIELPNGDSVASIEPWAWPDAFDGVSADDARKVQIEILQMDEPPRAHHSSASWVGNVIARVLGLDVDDKADKSRITTMIKTWIKTGVLEQAEVRDTKKGRDVPVILAGKNNPAATVEG